jgi:hypothetical protein
MTSDALQKLKKTLLDSYKKYGSVDYSTEGNSILITDDLEESSLTRYAEKGMMLNPVLTKLMGMDIWTGYWR